MKNPRVSVVIPVFGRPEALDRAVASALEQTRPVHEVIIVDDGSSPPIDPANYNDDRARVIRSERNLGGAHARNIGIKAATGDWIALLDSDDLWIPEKLDRQFSALGDRVDEPRTLAACNVLVRAETSLDPYNRAPPQGSYGDWILIDMGTLQTSGLLYPTQLARSRPFDETLRRHQDWDLVLRLLADGTVLSYVHDPLVIYEARRDPARVSQSPNVAPTLDWFDRVGPLISNRAKQNYYVRRLFKSHLRESPAAAVRTLGRFVAAAPLALLPLAWRLLAMGTQRVCSDPR